MTDSWFCSLPDVLRGVPVGGSARLAADVVVDADPRTATRDFTDEWIGVTSSPAPLERGTAVGVLAERRMAVHAASAADTELVVRLLGAPGQVADDSVLSPVMLRLMLALSS